MTHSASLCLHSQKLRLWVRVICIAKHLALEGHCWRDQITALAEPQWQHGSSVRDWRNQTSEFSFPLKWMVLLVPPTAITVVFRSAMTSYHWFSEGTEPRSSHTTSLLILTKTLWVGHCQYPNFTCEKTEIQKYEVLISHLSGLVRKIKGD